MNVLLDCDAVFERLTRGPFPGDAQVPGDARLLPADAEQNLERNVESHLRVCHECRALAEALRPAVHLLHEAYRDDTSAEYFSTEVARKEAAPAGLPAYRGGLERATAEPLAYAPARSTRDRALDKGREWSIGWQLVAASLIGVIVGASLWGGGRGSGGMGLFVGSDSGSERPQPSSASLAALVALHLPTICMPHDLAMADTTAQATAQRERCCTQCHTAQAGEKKGIDVVRLQLACVACHEQ